MLTRLKAVLIASRLMLLRQVTLPGRIANVAALKTLNITKSAAVQGRTTEYTSVLTSIHQLPIYGNDEIRTPSFFGCSAQQPAKVLGYIQPIISSI
jgi:hypothetical protein